MNVAAQRNSMTQLILGLAFVSTMFAADPFVGTWKLDPTKSSGTFPKDETVIVQERGRSLSVEIQVTLAGPDNSALLIKYSARKSGGAGQVEKGPYEAISIRRVDSRTIETTYNSGGKDTRSTRSAVSNDGNSMTTTGKALGPEDHSTWVMVFQKQPGSKP
jgi:hypothetical protein